MLKPVLQTFLDKPPSLEDSDYILFSVPLDITTSYRRGTRFGPAAIRKESSYLDAYNPRTELDWEDIKIADAGEIECATLEGALDGIVKTIESTKAIPVMLGGEHTITLGALRALKPELVLVFDAHLDLREELFGDKLCHATYLRRAYEELGCKVVIIGARALSKGEVKFAEVNSDVLWFSASEVMKDELNISNKVSRFIDNVDSFYLSIDMDVLDPVYAPAVGNPYPEGLSVTVMMNIINTSVNRKLLGLDLVEVYPSYDSGLTATTAAYIIMETLYSHINNRKTRLNSV